MFGDVLDCVHIDDTLSLEAGEARRFEHRGVAGLRLCHASLTVGWSIQKVLLAVVAGQLLVVVSQGDFLRF